MYGTILYILKHNSSQWEGTNESLRRLFCCPPLSREEQCELSKYFVDDKSLYEYKDERNSSLRDRRWRETAELARRGQKCNRAVGPLSLTISLVPLFRDYLQKTSKSCCNVIEIAFFLFIIHHLSQFRFEFDYVVHKKYIHKVNINDYFLKTLLLNNVSFKISKITHKRNLNFRTPERD